MIYQCQDGKCYPLTTPQTCYAGDVGDSLRQPDGRGVSYRYDAAAQTLQVQALGRDGKPTGTLEFSVPATAGAQGQSSAATDDEVDDAMADCIDSDIPDGWDAVAAFLAAHGMRHA